MKLAFSRVITRLVVIVALWCTISAATSVPRASYKAELVPTSTTSYPKSGFTLITLGVNVTGIPNAQDIRVEPFWSCASSNAEDHLDVSSVSAFAKTSNCPSVHKRSESAYLLCNSATSTWFTLRGIRVNHKAHNSTTAPLSIIADCFRLRVGGINAVPAPELTIGPMAEINRLLALPPPVTAFTVTRAAVSLAPVIRSPFEAAMNAVLDLAFTLPYAADAYTELGIVLATDSGLAFRDDATDPNSGAGSGASDGAGVGFSGVRLSLVSGDTDHFLDSCVTKRVSKHRINLRCVGLTAGDWVFRLNPVTIAPAAHSNGALSALPANAVTLVLNNKLTYTATRTTTATDNTEGAVTLTELPALFEDDKADSNTSSFVTLDRSTARLTVYTAALATDPILDIDTNSVANNAATRVAHVRIAPTRDAQRLARCNALELEFTPALALTTVADAAIKASASPFLRPVCREARSVDHGSVAVLACDVPAVAAVTMFVVALTGVRENHSNGKSTNGNEDVSACFDVAVTVDEAPPLASSHSHASGARGLGMKTQALAQARAQAQAQARVVSSQPLVDADFKIACEAEQQLSNSTVVNMSTAALKSDNDSYNSVSVAATKPHGRKFKTLCGGGGGSTVTPEIDDTETIYFSVIPEFQNVRGLRLSEFSRIGKLWLSVYHSISGSARTVSFVSSSTATTRLNFSSITSDSVSGGCTLDSLSTSKIILKSSSAYGAADPFICYVDNVIITSTVQEISYTIAASDFSFTESTGSVSPTVALSLDCWSAFTFNYEYFHGGPPQNYYFSPYTTANFASRYTSRTYYLYLVFRFMRLGTALPSSTTTITITGACTSIYALRLYESTTDLSSYSFTFSTSSKMPTTDTLYLHAKVGAIIGPVPMSCFSIYDVGTSATQSPTLPTETWGLSTTPGAFVYHVNGAAAVNTVDQPTATMISLTREFGFNPSLVGTLSTSLLTVSIAGSTCFCPSQSSVLASVSTVGTSTAVSCNIAATSTTVGVTLTCPPLSGSTWNIFAITCVGGFSLSALDSCLSSSLIGAATFSGTYADGTSFTLSAADPVTMGNTPVGFATVKLSKRAASAAIVTTNPVSTPTTVLVTFYLYYVNLPTGSSGIAFNYDSSYYSYSSTSITFGSTYLSTGCTVSTQLNITCSSAFSKRYDSASSDYIPNFTASMLEPNGLKAVNPPSSALTISLGGSSYGSVTGISCDQSEVRYAYLVTSDGYTQSGSTFYDSIRIFYLPLSPAAYGTMNFYLSTPPKLDSTVTWVGSTTKSGVTPTIAQASTTSEKITITSSIYGYYSVWTASSGVSVTSSEAASYPSGFDGNFYYLALGTMNLTASSGSVLGPYVDQSVATTFSFTTTAAAVTGYTSASNQRTITATLTAVIGTNGSSRILTISVLASCSLDLSTATATGTLTKTGSGSTYISLTVPDSIAKGMTATTSIAGMVVTSTAGATTWPSTALATSCFTSQITISGSAVAGTATSDNTLPLFLSGSPVTYNFFAPATVALKFTVQLSTATSVSARFTRYYHLSQLTIMFIALTTGTSVTYTVAATCTGYYFLVSDAYVSSTTVTVSHASAHVVSSSSLYIAIGT